MTNLKQKIFSGFPIFLAPMEGVLDFYLREILTSVGGLDVCVSEFIRVTDQTLPHKVFFRDAPELKNNAITKSSTPVILQLLGGDPARLAEHAQIAVSLGANGIDLNFGCPAKTVNRHDGGATLLLYPERIEKIVSAVRCAIPKTVSVSAKIRLGFKDTDLFLKNALAVQDGGADWLTVHCRTKEQMYQPPIDWRKLLELKEHIRIPIIANGDIFTVADALNCIRLVNPQGLMLGRGMLRNPFLAQQIKMTLSCQKYENSNFGDWAEAHKLVLQLRSQTESEVSSAFAKARTKQWLRELTKGPFPEAIEVFNQIKSQ